MKTPQLLLASLLLTSPLALQAAEAPPEKPVGISGAGEAVGLVDLAPHELAGNPADYRLRSRTVGIAPGGAIHEHPHHGRPGVVLVTHGTVIEYRGSQSRQLEVGDSWYENADTVHWFRNPSDSEAAELWVVDLVPAN